MPVFDPLAAAPGWFDPELDSGSWFTDELSISGSGGAPYFETDEFQIKCSGSADREADATVYYCGLSLEFCVGDRATTGIKLTSLRQDVGDPGDPQNVYTLEIPDISPGSWTVNNAESATLDSVLKIYDLVIDESPWTVTFSSIDWVVDGVVELTLSGDTLTGSGSGVENIPLIGIKPKLEALLSTGPLLGCPPVVSVTEFDRSVSIDGDAGYRYLDSDGLTWVNPSRTHRIVDAPTNGDECSDPSFCYDTFDDKVTTPATTWGVTFTAETFVKEFRTLIGSVLCECPPACPGPGLWYDVYSYEVWQSLIGNFIIYMPTPGYDPAEYTYTAYNTCGCLPGEEPVTVTDGPTVRTRDADENVWCMSRSVCKRLETHAFKQNPSAFCGPCDPPNVGEEPHDPTPTPCWTDLEWECCVELYSCTSWTLPEPGTGGTSADIGEDTNTVVYYIDSGGEIQGRLYDNASNLVESWTTGLFAESLHVKIDKRQRTPRVRLYTVESGQCYVRQSTNGGVTFGSATALGAGTHVTAEIAIHGTEFVYRNDAGTIRGIRYDRAGNALEAAFVATTGADADTAIAATGGPIVSGGQTIRLWYLAGGALTFKESIDGITFT